MCSKGHKLESVTYQKDGIEVIAHYCHSCKTVLFSQEDIIQLNRKMIG